MAHPRRRPAVQAAVAAIVLLGALSGPPPEARPVFRPSPGPIDHPLAIGTADFDRDGHDDLVIAEYQAAVIELLVGKGDGTFTPIPSGPIGVGTTTFSTPTTGPLALVVTDLNPADVDSDTIPNASDNCPNVPNGPGGSTTSQLDANTNGVGDACETLTDTNNDGTGDAPIDTDGDGVVDYDPVSHKLDNCPRMRNPGQEDLDTAKGSDGICGTSDDNPLLNGADLTCGTADDRIGDGVGDACAKSPDLLILTTSVGSGSPLGAVRVRMNDGSGGMVNRPSYVTGVAPTQILVEDIGGDRVPDLLVVNASINLVQVFPGIGDGQFTNGFLLTTGIGPQAIVTADIDDDKDRDVIVANGTAGTLSLYRNAPGALPTTPTETFITAPHPTVLLAGNLNNKPPTPDTFEDIVALTQGELKCSDAGPLDPSPRKGLPCQTDMDCADLVNPGNSGTCQGGIGGVQVFAGAPAGGATGLVAGFQMNLPTVPTSSRPRAGALRDLDGDGDLDLLIADFAGGNLLILTGNGDGTFATTPTALPLGGGPADLAFLTLDPPNPSALAVLDATNDRVDLLEQGSGTNFSLASTSPASPWRNTTSMALIGADSIVGFDAVLLQQEKARVDIVSGIGDGSFRATPILEPKADAVSPAVPGGTAFVAADLRQDGRPDLAILDGPAKKVTILTGETNGQLLERKTFTTTHGADRIEVTPLYESIVDYDGDGQANVIDDCPTVYNPPGCKVTDNTASCVPVTLACTDTTLMPTDCATVDPVTGQCDSDGNGIGDQCQILSAATATPTACFAVDSDFDLKADYDQNALKRTGAGALDFDGDGFANTLDNCPTIANADQTDTDTNGVGDACQVLVDDDGDGVKDDPVDSDGDEIFDYNPADQSVDNCPLIPNKGQEDNNDDHVGNACVIAAALDNCLSTLNPQQEDREGDGIGNACAGPTQDLFLIDSATPGGGTIDILHGDNAGGFRPAAVSLPPLVGPTAVRSGHFTLDCTLGAGCVDRTVFDLAVTEAGTTGNSTDDRITVYAGAPATTPPFTPPFTPLPAFALSGEPTRLLRAADQPVCTIPGSVTNPFLRFSKDGQADLLLALGAGNSTLSVLLPSNQNDLDAALSPLVRPVAFNAPILLAGPPADLLLADVNQDRRQDVVVLTTAGNQTTIRPYLGIGNGLFFTDPTLETVLPFTATRVTSANVDLKTDSIYPDLVVFETRDQAPFSVLNVLPLRADIDGSGRVDGGDLELLAGAFGASRGEDFTLLPDATFAQTGTGGAAVLTHTGAFVPGQDLPDSTGFCDNRFNGGTPRYGVPVDINLDGIVDGVDLAFLASRFGSSIP
jgi:hypothetical protein